MKTQNLAVLVTDIAGFTNATARQTREQNAQWLATHAALLVPVFHAFGGTVRKEMGDAFLVTFPSPTDAVLCGTVVLDRLWQHNRSAAPLMRLNVRVVVNMGEVRVEKNGVFGDPVNLAAKVEEVAEGGQITLTEAVFLTMNRSEADMEPLGPHTLPGSGEPVNLYRVKPQSVPPGPDELAPSYPFGALHMHRLNAPAPAARAADGSTRTAVQGALDGVQRVGDVVTDRRLWRRVAVAVGALALLVGGGWGAWRTFSSWKKDPFRAVEERLAAGDAMGASKAWDDADAQKAQPAWKLDYLLGRISRLEGECADMLGAYRDALKANDALADDKHLNADVVSCLDKSEEKARKLIRDRLGKKAARALRDHAANKGAPAASRLVSIELLDEMGELDGGDAKDTLLAILRSNEPCKLRREAVLRMAGMKDKGVRGPLSDVLKESEPGAPQAKANACLVGALQEAIRDLE